MQILNNLKIVDLTHPLNSNVPTWNGSCGFSLESKSEPDHMFRVHQVKMHAGIGTHMDAPCHRIKGGASISEIPLEHLIVPICLIDVSEKAGADYEVSLQDIEEYEKKHGLILKNSLVIAYTGWNRFWQNPSAYRNVDPSGHMQFPALSAHAAEFLLKRNIAGIGIDTLSPDCADPTFPVHRTLLAAGKYIIENIADCSEITPKGSYAIAFPMRIEEGTESPVRIAGLVPIHSNL